MKRIKTIYAAALALLLFLGMPQCVFAESVDNPFQLTGLDIEKGTTEFTVSVQVTGAAVLSAFDLSVEYDAEVLELVASEKEPGYAFSGEFLEYFQGGMISCNNKNDQAIVFAGAKMKAGEYSGTLGEVSFRVKDTAQAATTVVRLCVHSVGRETEQGVEVLEIWNPSVGKRLVLKDREGLAGDVNADGQIDLRDVQLALKAALRIVQLDKQQAEAADLNFNGEADLSDAQVILKKALKIVDE